MPAKRGGSSGYKRQRANGGNNTSGRLPDNHPDAPYGQRNGIGGSALETNRQHQQRVDRANAEARQRLGEAKPPRHNQSITIRAYETSASITNIRDILTGNDVLSVVIQGKGGTESKRFSINDFSGAKKYVRRKLKL